MLYSKRKKMAKGGQAYKNDSAATEQRAMPSETDNDSKMVKQNDSIKPAKNDNWTDNPTVEQARRPSRTPLKRPRMVGSDAFSVRDRDEVDEDLHRMSSEAPASPKEQPPRRDDEEEATKSGPKVPDMQKQHNNSKPAYAKGGEVEAQDMEVRPDKGFGKIIIFDKEKQPHMSEGGEVEDERQEERHASIVASIMAKRKVAEELNSDSDEDEMVLMAEGGEIHSHDSIYSDNSSQVDLNRNADEDANEEDQLSFNALRKENYSESEGLNQLNQPKDSNEHGDAREDADSDHKDMIDRIMKKMQAKRA